MRESQEAVELALKAALRWVAIEPVRTHNPSDQLLAARARFPAWFREQLDALREISDRLAAERGPSFYGDEAAGVPPGELFDAEDAHAAVADGSKVLAACERLVRDPSINEK